MSARLTPYELAFPAERFESAVFPAIRDEAESRGVSPVDIDRFFTIEAVGLAMRDPSRPGDIRDPADAPLPARGHGTLLFHAFRFWQAGRHVFTLDESLTRRLTGSTERVGSWRLEPPTVSGYVQLPRHIVWARVSDDAPAESVDGFFWVWSEARPTAGEVTARLDALLALGMHPDRPGFSAVELTGWLPPPPDAHWADVRGRDEGNDFDSVLPGGEMRGLLSLTTVAETLELVSRVFHYIASHPERVEPSRVQPVRESTSPLDMPPSQLPASAVTLETGS